MNEGEMNETDVGLSVLPEGWVETTIGEIAQTIHYGYTESATNEPVGPKFLRITDIQNNSVNWDTVPYCRIKGDEQHKYILKEGDLVFARTGATVGKSFLIRGRIPDAVFASYLIRIVLDKKINANFVYTFFYSQFYWVQIHQGKVGIGQPNVNAKILAQITLPLPPLPEQHRIVAKIEELFTKLDAGKEELLQAKARLKHYRQSVLKSAMEGKLTEDWRKKHGGEIEPASILLDRILKERREKWEAEQLAQMRAKGKMPKDDKWKNKYKEPQPPDTTKLPELPEGWVWTTVSSIGLVASGQTPKGINDFDSKGKIPFYKISDMNKSGNEKFMRATAIALDDVEIEKLGIHVREQGTVIFPKRGGAIATNKKRILSYPSAYDLNIMGVLPYIVPTDFFYQWLLSINLATLSDGSNVPQLNHKHIDPLPFALPSLSEQQAIVFEVERRLSVADAVEATVDAELKRSDALRQSILKQAFSGQLVPQDPNDEPASVLLERIKEDKMKRETEQKSKRKPKKTIIREQGLTKINDLLVGKTQYTRIYDTLKSVGQPLPLDELLELSRLDVDEFYAQLKAEIESGRIAERRSDKTTVFLEGKNEA